MRMHLEEVWKTNDERDLRLIHSRALDAVEGLKRCEAAVIRCLQDVDRKLVYRFLGFASLFQYAVQALRLSDNQASNFITVARKSRDFPALQAAIESGELSVSKARKVTPVLNEANQAEWVDLAINSTCRDIERKVAAHSPRAAVPERFRYISETVLELNAPVSEETFKLLKRAQDLVCGSEAKAVTLDETIRALAEFYLERKDPVRKAERAERRKESCVTRHVSVNPSQLGATQPTPQNAYDTKRLPKKPNRRKRVALKAAIKNQVHARDKGRCQARMANGAICGETRWCDVHHFVPVALGGQDTVENLVTLCRGHHRACHDFEGMHQSSEARRESAGSAPPVVASLVAQRWQNEFASSSIKSCASTGAGGSPPSSVRAR